MSTLILHCNALQIHVIFLSLSYEERISITVEGKKFETYRKGIRMLTFAMGTDDILTERDWTIASDNDTLLTMIQLKYDG